MASGQENDTVCTKVTKPGPCATLNLFLYGDQFISYFLIHYSYHAYSYTASLASCEHR